MIDTTSSKSTVYLRRNLTSQQVTDENNETKTVYFWEEATVSKDEYNQHGSLVLDDNLTRDEIDNAPIGDLSGYINDDTIINGIESGSLVVIHTYYFTDDTRMQVIESSKNVRKTRTYTNGIWTEWI
jgi:hypothetical protein